MIWSLTTTFNRVILCRPSVGFGAGMVWLGGRGDFGQMRSAFTGGKPATILQTGIRFSDSPIGTIAASVELPYFAHKNSDEQPIQSGRYRATPIPT